MAKGYFYVYPSRLDDYEIILQPNENCKEKIPKVQRELYVLVKKTNSVIKNLFEYEEKKEKEKKKRQYIKRQRTKKKNKRKEQREQRRQLRKAEREKKKAESLRETNTIEETAVPPIVSKEMLYNEAGKIIVEPEEEDVDIFEEYEKRINKFEKYNTVKGNNDVKEMYANNLLHNAQAGLVGEYAQPELATEAIKVLKEEIVLREGGKIKNRNLYKLGICAFTIGFVSFALGYFLQLVANGTLLTNTGFGKVFANIGLYPYLIVFAGAVIGSWVGYGVESKTISFTELVIVHKDRLKHIPRLVLFGVTGMLLLLFFNAGIIEIKLGNITNEMLMTNTSYQLLLGVIAGLLGNKLTTGLVEKAADLFNSEEDENESDNKDAKE